MNPDNRSSQESSRERVPDIENSELAISETQGAKRDDGEIAKLDQEIIETEHEHSPEFDFSADTTWKKEAPCHDTATMNFGFDMRDFLATNDPQTELETQGDALREKIFRYVFKEAMPEIVKKSNHGKIPSHQDLQTDSRIDDESSTQHQQREKEFSAHMNIKMDIDMKSNRDVHPIIALHNISGQVASSVSHSMMQNLEREYLGKENSDVRTDFETKAGKVVAFEATD